MLHEVSVLNVHSSRKLKVKLYSYPLQGLVEIFLNAWYPEDRNLLKML